MNNVNRTKPNSTAAATKIAEKKKEHKKYKNKTKQIIQLQCCLHLFTANILTYITVDRFFIHNHCTAKISHIIDYIKLCFVQVVPRFSKMKCYTAVLQNVLTCMNKKPKWPSCVHYKTLCVVVVRNFL
jgi:hypothetical protein